MHSNSLDCLDMAEEKVRIPPVSGDIGRRAHAAIRGFLYQFWRTVEAWIELNPEELLYVEGAEDVDIVRGADATIVQIKDNRASGTLTLGNAGALSAIKNYWFLRERNPGRPVHFKFVTTASAGEEKSAFQGEKGIEVWNLCRESPFTSCAKDVERIRSFLREKPMLGEDVIDFLSEASAEVVKKELVDGIEWIYDQPGYENIQAIIINRLLVMGEARGLSMRDARALAEKLCLVVADAAANRAIQNLDLGDLKKHLDEAVNIEVPREILRQISASLLPSFSRQDDEVRPQLVEGPDEFLPPVMFAGAWQRERLIDSFRRSANEGLVYLVGGVGMGKTTLILQGLDPARGVLWASLRDLSTQDILQVCRRLLRRIATNSNRSSIVVLDDCNFSSDFRLVERELATVAALVQKRRDILVLTAYNAPGPRLRSILGLEDRQIITIPSLSQEEVQTFLGDAGCPSERLLSLSRLVWFQTSGHPQLVSARVSTLKTAGFPEPSEEAFFVHSEDIKDARAEAHAFVHTLPDNARRLLYEVSVSVPPLRRSHILRLANANPPIPFPGVILDSVIGPWLQQVAPQSYRVSPLLLGVTKEVFPEEHVKRIHGNLSRALLSERTLTPQEFGGVFSHGLLGEAGDSLVIAAKAFMEAPTNVKEVLARELSWIAGVALEDDALMRVLKPAVGQMFRLVQWEIASIVEPRLLTQIAGCIERETCEKDHGAEQVLLRIVYLSRLLLQPNYPLSISKVIKHVLEIKRLLERPPVEAGGELTSICIDPSDPPLAKLFLVGIVRCVRTMGDLQDLLRIMDEISEVERNFFVSSLSALESELRLLFNNVWLSLPKHDQEQQKAYEELLAKAIAAGRRWAVPGWMRAAARVRAAVLDEMLDRESDAVRVIEEIAHEVGGSFHLEEQLALIAFNRGEYKTALAAWQRILPPGHNDNMCQDIQTMLGLRYAAISASRLGEWREASNLYKEAIGRAKSFDEPCWRIGLRADYAYAVWKTGEYPLALDCLKEVVNELQTSSNSPDSFPEYAVQKLIGNMMRSLLPDSPSSYVEGMCSDPYPNRDFNSMPAVPPIFYWHLLQRLAVQAGDKRLGADCLEKFEDAPFASLRATASMERTCDALENGRFEEVLKHSVSCGLEMEKADARRAQPVYVPDPERLTAHLTLRSINVYVRPALIAAALHDKAADRDVGSRVQEWSAETEHKCPQLEEEWIVIETLMGASPHDIAGTMENGTQSAAARLWAAVLLIGNDAAVMRSVCYAHVILLDYAMNFEILRRAGGSAFDQLVRRDWTRFRSNAFQLRSPRLYVSEIDQALGAPERSWATAASVMLSGLPAVDLELPNEIRERLRKTASGG